MPPAYSSDFVCLKRSTDQSWHSLGAGNSDYIVLSDAYDAKGGNGGGHGGPPIGGGGGSDPVVTDTYTSGDDSVDDSLEFNITIEFLGEWSDEMKAIFIASADYLSSVIDGDMADVDYNGQLIDDIVIQASLTEIDNTGGILGQAGPTVVRSADYTPIMGVMEFDIADAQAWADLGYFDDIVLHEMMHVLGFGTLWDYNGLTENVVIDDNGTKKPTDDTIDTIYTGEAANAAHDSDPDTFIFVETDGGSGTAGGHWDEDTYLNELMTGFIGYTDPETGTRFLFNYLSDWSVAALQDLGYTLDPNAGGLTPTVELV